MASRTGQTLLELPSADGYDDHGSKVAALMAVLRDQLRGLGEAEEGADERMGSL